MKKKSTSKLVRHSLGEDGSAPARRSLGEGGFFNLRVLIGLFVSLAGVFLALLGFGTFSNVSAQPNADTNGQGAGQMKVTRPEHSDLSPPLRDQPVIWPQAGEEREPNVPLRMPIEHMDAPDPVIQNSFWQPLLKTPAIPAPIQQWAGIGKPCKGCSTVPPDTDGAVGKTQYVEMVNVALQVFDKLTGTSLLGPIPIDSVWAGFGGPCYSRGNGDPIVVYDRLADRWVISQFATASGAAKPQDECIAVSQTGDATGRWYRYHFHLTNERIQDYPKFGVWPDGYYMSANVSVFGFGLLPQPFVFDRARMLIGDPAATVQTPGVIESPDEFSREASFLPSDLDGILPPPLGAANHFVAFPQQDTAPPGSLIYKVWAFHVDWDHPGNSWFRVEARIPAADFSRLRDDVPQLGVTNLLDSLGDRLMFRNAYRRFPDGHESLLNNFTVSANSVAGIRWFELHRAPPGNWTLRQESTYQPDSTWRWMGSIASDNQGNIALGFSASSATIHPQIRYAGRSATDPLNVLSGEQHLFNGTGSQPNDDRWGDYSDMTIDPVDDCTFYYTNEYYATTSYRDWQTRIGYFKFAPCTPPQKGSAHFVVCDRGAPLSNASVSIDGRAYGASVTDGTYDAVLPPGSHTYAVSNPAFATQTGNFSITNDQTTLVDLCPGGGGGTGLTIIQPNGGEHWLTESAQRIKWDGANLKQSDRLIIQYSRDGGATWFRIAQDIPALSLSYSWQVDSFPTTQARVKILLQGHESITDQSDANFTVQRTYITLLRPNGGEVWTIGQNQNIHWSRQNPGLSTVDIDYSADNGATWRRITFPTGAEDTGFYLWKVRGPATTAAKVRIRFHETPWLTDISDAVFTTVSP
jgi:hypothetical protein